MKVTVFYDMHSGGNQKENFSCLIIQADEETATLVFQNRFGHNPRRISCTCCGPDYSISEFDSLAEAQECYPNAKLADEIKPEERLGALREEGWTWK